MGTMRLSIRMSFEKKRPIHESWSFKRGSSSYTLDHYETEYADRHLIHGALVKWAQETPTRVALIDTATEREYTYQELNELTDRWAIQCA